MDAYKTLKDKVLAKGELTDKKSRFIAHLQQVKTKDEADAFLAALRKEHYDARHAVCAYRFSTGEERASDDGEPQRTAGAPSLEQLRAHNLKDVCVVTVRYFGGTLLGPGGLIRAYEGAVRAAIENAEQDGTIVEMLPLARLVFCIPYAAYGKVERMIQDAGGKVEDQIFSEDVQITAHFREGEYEALLNALVELFQGDEVAKVYSHYFGPY